MIRYLESKEIDRSAWDKCVASSSANLVYAHSWYLDLVSEGWCGIIEDDYKVVMPLPAKKKYGIRYIIQPPLSQQLGLFSAKNINSGEVSDFIKKIPSFYKFIDINMNFTNDLSELSFVSEIRVNLELSLAMPGDLIVRNFSENTTRNIEKARSAIEIKESRDAEQVISMLKLNPVEKRNPEYYEWLKMYMEEIIRRGEGFIIEAHQGGVICAILFLIVFKGRIYYLIPVSDKTGKALSAMFGIVDYIIRKFCGTEYILDFEGSNIEGIARFYKGFGAKPVNYPRVRINRLPFPVNLFR